VDFRATSICQGGCVNPSGDGQRQSFWCSPTPCPPQYPQFRFPDQALGMFAEVRSATHIAKITHAILTKRYSVVLLAKHYTTPHHPLHVFVPRSKAKSGSVFRTTAKSGWRHKVGCTSVLPTRSICVNQSPSGVLVNATWMDSTTSATKYLVCLRGRRYLFLLDIFNEVLSYLSTICLFCRRPS
jgi:hypothetical protein